MSARIPRRGRRGSMAPLVEWSPPSLFRHPGQQRPNFAPEAFDLRANRLDLRQGHLADGTLHIQAGWWASRDQRGQRDILGGMWHINDHGRRLHSGADVGRLRVCPPRRRDRRPPWLSRDTLRASSLTATRADPRPSGRRKEARTDVRGRQGQNDLPSRECAHSSVNKWMRPKLATRNTRLSGVTRISPTEVERRSVGTAAGSPTRVSPRYQRCRRRRSPANPMAISARVAGSGTSTMRKPISSYASEAKSLNPKRFVG